MLHTTILSMTSTESLCRLLRSNPDIDHDQIFQTSSEQNHTHREPNPFEDAHKIINKLKSGFWRSVRQDKAPRPTPIDHISDFQTSFKPNQTDN